MGMFGHAVTLILKATSHFSFHIFIKQKNSTGHTWLWWCSQIMSILALGSVDIISHKSSKASNFGNIPKTNRHIQISFSPVKCFHNSGWNPVGVWCVWTRCLPALPLWQYCLEMSLDTSGALYVHLEYTKKKSNPSLQALMARAEDVINPLLR